MSLMNHELDGQFVLSKISKFIPDKWNIKENTGWILATHPSLPVLNIETASGSNIGWIIGFPIDLNSRFLSTGVVFNVEMNKNPRYKDIESNLYKLGGRYVAIILVEGISRVYLDPGGSLSVVYALDEPVIASTPSLIELNDGFDDELIAILSMPDSGLYYPSGLTPRRGLRRLLPNHFLELSSWKSFRHWPVDSELKVDNDVGEAVEKIIKILKNNLHAIAKNHFIHLSLTAGRESRMLLACAREILDKIDFFTFVNDKQTVDSHIAGILAKKFNLKHRFLRSEYALETEKEDCLYRVGHCVSGRIWMIHPTLRHLDRKRALLPGMGGEIARSYFWSRDREIKLLDAKAILDRLHLPVCDKTLIMTEEWLSEISDLSPSLVLDLAYIEQRLGCWAGPQMYGSDHRSVCHLWPLSHRRIFQLMLQLPSEYKLKQQLAKDICALEWPELLDAPFNDFSGPLKYVKRAGRYTRSIKKTALKKLKGIFS